jgi:hypothetical protein
VINRAREGSTSQKMLLERAVTLDGSLVSTYSHTMARTETTGADANSAPMKELRFDNSEITTIKNAVMISFTM